MLYSFWIEIKDVTPFDKRTDLVYSIPCSGCDHVYMGETLQHLEKRIKRHNLDERKLNDETVLPVHSRTSGHRFSFKDTKILLHESNTKKRRIREAIEILKSKSVNFKCDTSNLRSTYESLLNHTL